MAHTCPDCGLVCYCGGDIDDICFGEDLGCTHYRECQPAVGDGDDWNWQDDEWPAAEEAEEVDSG